MLSIKSKIIYIISLLVVETAFHILPCLRINKLQSYSRNTFSFMLQFTIIYSLKVTQNSCTLNRGFLGMIIATHLLHIPYIFSPFSWNAQTLNLGFLRIIFATHSPHSPHLTLYLDKSKLIINSLHSNSISYIFTTHSHITYSLHIQICWPLWFDFHYTFECIFKWILLLLHIYYTFSFG